MPNAHTHAREKKIRFKKTVQMMGFEAFNCNALMGLKKRFDAFIFFFRLFLSLKLNSNVIAHNWMCLIVLFGLFKPKFIYMISRSGYRKLLHRSFKRQSAKKTNHTKKFAIARAHVT